MTRERAKSLDHTSYGRFCTAEAPGKLCRPAMASPEHGRMLAFAPSQGFIWGMSVKVLRRSQADTVRCRVTMVAGAYPGVVPRSFRLSLETPR
jgi:hypothetical protein